MIGPIAVPKFGNPVRYLSGRRILPEPIVAGMSVVDLVENAFLAYNGRRLREARYASGAATSWGEWWQRAAADEFLGPKAVERERIYPLVTHHQEWTPPALWHVDALRVAGFAEAGVLWRGGTDAAVVGLRSADAA